jgi:PST family polysaccharide transporter
MPGKRLALRKTMGPEAGKYEVDGATKLMTIAPQPDARLKNLTKGALTGATWIFVANVSTLALRVMFLAVLARLLSPADFGLAAVATSFSAFANLFSDAGVSNTLVQRKELTESHVSTAFAYSLTLGIAFMLLTIGTSGLAEAFFKMPGLSPVLSVMGISFALQALCVVPRALLQREMKFRTLAIADFTAFNLGYGLTACVLASLNFGVWALVIALTTHSALSALFYFAYAPHKLSLRFHRHAFKDLIGTSSGFSLAAVANLIALQADNLIVGQVLGARYLGYYSRAYQLMTIPASALGQVTSHVVFPMLARIQEDRIRLQRAFLRGTAISSLAGLPASVLVPLYSPEIVHILFGPKWLPITSILGILGVGTYFRLGYKVPGAVLQASGHVGTNALIQCVYAACVVIGVLLAVHYSLDLVAGVIVGSVGVVFLLANYLTMRVLHIRPSSLIRAIAMPLAITVVLGCANYVLIAYIRPYGIVPLTAAGVVVSTLIVLVPLCVANMRNVLLKH